MRKVLNFVKGKKEDKKDHNLTLNVSPISVEITDPAGVTTPSDDYDFVETPQKSSDYDVDLSGKDKSITKLHKVSWIGNLEKVKTQLKKTDVNTVDKMNRTPLHLAVAQGHTNVVWFLLGNKARLDIYDTGGKTPFLKAVECGFKDIVQQMLEKNAEIDSVDTEGNSALHIATRLGFYDIATLLLKKGADFESANKRGEYALHIATTAEHIDLVELLLRYGANVNASDSGNRSPLMLAAKFGNQPLIELFLEFGAHTSAEDSSSLTAADYAKHGGFEEIADKLAVTKKPDEIPPAPVKESSQPEEPQQDVVVDNQKVAVLKEVPDGNDTDTWNDSQLSEQPAAKPVLPPVLKTTSPPAADRLSDDEVPLSPSKDDPIVHDSPHSCVIPPPLKPPRSWDLIQAGMIDDNQGTEVKRRSLTTLGTLRSRRESFTESKSEAESSLNEGKRLKEVKPATIADIPDTITAEKNKSDLSLQDSDWGSDDSLPLDKSSNEVDQSGRVSEVTAVVVHQESAGEMEMEAELPQPPSPSQLLQVEESHGSTAVSPEPLSERRARMMLLRCEQSVELTLTEDKTDDNDKSDHSEGSSAAFPPEVEVEQVAPSEEGTLGRDGTMLGYDELWTGNAQMPPPDLVSSLTDKQPEGTPEREPEHEPEPESQIVIQLETPSVVQVPQDSAVIESLAKQLEEAADKNSKAPSARRHSRQKSIFVLPSPAPPPQVQVDLQQTYLDKQLECYDEAIRDLSAAQADPGGRVSPEAPQQVTVTVAVTETVTETETDTAGAGEPAATEDLGKSDARPIAGPSKSSASTRPIRRKRKLLLAMRAGDATASAQEGDRIEITDSSSDQDDDEDPYWGGKVPRQATVIRLGGDEGSDEADQPPSWLSPGTGSVSSDLPHVKLSSGTSNEDVTVPMEDMAGDGSDVLQLEMATSSDVKKTSANEGADSPSEASQQERSSSHHFSVNHDSLLKHHLQAVTEERSRLAETTVELGERTERLLYELADAREAARASSEVISILQQQLARLEETHRRGLEDAQAQQYHLDNRDQELRHLSEVLGKIEEEKYLLKDIIALKDKEIASLRKAEAVSPVSEKDANISELKIHLKYVEQERDKLATKVSVLEANLSSAQERCHQLLEEKARLSEQTAQELFSAKNECSKWKNLYESSLVKIEAIDATQVKILMEGKASQNDAVQAYREEIRHAVERIEKDKEEDRKMWHTRIKEEVTEAVAMLKSEYEAVVTSLKKQNEVLDNMVKKLEKDFESSVKRCKDLESQLATAQQDLSVVSQLQETLSEMKLKAVSSSHQLETLSTELEAKRAALAKANEALEAMQLKNDRLATAITETKRLHAGGDADVSGGLKSVVEELKQDLQQARVWANESSNKVQQCNQWAGELQRQLIVERERAALAAGDKMAPMGEKLSPSAEVRLSDALTMTDQVRWNSSGLMGVVQKQKEEIDSLKAECQRLRKSLEMTPQVSRMSRDSITLLRATKEILSETCTGNNIHETKRTAPVVSPRKMTDPNKCKSNKRVTASPKRQPKEGDTIESGQLEGCNQHAQLISSLKSDVINLRVSMNRQITELRNQVKEEHEKRLAAEKQINRMKYEVKDNVWLESEVNRLRRDLSTLQNNLKTSWFAKDHIEAEAPLRSELNIKLAQVNKILLQQANEHEKRATMAVELQKEQENMRQHLISELAKVQASLEAKEVEERELKIKCDRLSEESARRSEAERKKLIEKSLSLNIDQNRPTPNLEKNPAPRTLRSAPKPAKGLLPLSAKMPCDPYSELLRQQVQTSVAKYKSAECFEEMASVCNPEVKQKYLLS